MKGETVNFSEMAKVASDMRKEGECLIKRADSLSSLACSKAEVSQLESTIDSIKREIVKNNGVLKESQDKIKGINGKVQDAELKAEGEIAKINDGVKQEEKGSLERVKIIRDEESRLATEIRKSASESIKASGEAEVEAKNKANLAIANKDQMEAECNKVADKIQKLVEVK